MQKLAIGEWVRMEEGFGPNRTKHYIGTIESLNPETATVLASNIRVTGPLFLLTPCLQLHEAKVGVIVEPISLTWGTYWGVKGEVISVVFGSTQADSTAKLRFPSGNVHDIRFTHLKLARPNFNEHAIGGGLTQLSFL